MNSETKHYLADPTISAYRCHKCHGSGHWRSGVGFENEKRCSVCNIVWEPYEIERERQFLAFKLQLTNGDGI